MRRTLIKSILIAGIFLSSCGPNTTTPEPPQTEQVFSLTSTPTFVIPTISPTETITPSPEPSPTSDPQAGLGDVILLDDFTQNQGWALFDDQIGAASIRQGKLFLTVSEARGLRYVLAPIQPISDFYAEVQVRPEICEPDDEYGVIFRINAQFEYYRFAINCEGMTRMSRTLTSGSRSLTPLEINSAVIPGPMASNLLAIRATGDQFQFWINGIKVQTVRDVSLHSGTIGFFVRSGRGDLATISFDNLLIRGTTQQ